MQRLLYQNKTSLKEYATTPKENFWSNVRNIRGLLFTGHYASWDLLDMGFSLQEIKSAIRLNEKYYQRKLSEVGTFVFIG